MTARGGTSRSLRRGRRERSPEWNLAHCRWMEQAGLVWQGPYDEAERINEGHYPLNALLTGELDKARVRTISPESSTKQNRPQVV